MRNWTDSYNPAESRLPTENLKCCPLCGVLNAVQNEECFVCAWQGQFEHDPEIIEECLLELLDRCPELVEAMAQSISVPVPARPWWRRWMDEARSAFHRGLDYRV